MFRSKTTKKIAWHKNTREITSLYILVPTYLFYTLDVIKILRNVVHFTYIDYTNKKRIQKLLLRQINYQAEVRPLHGTLVLAALLKSPVKL